MSRAEQLTLDLAFPTEPRTDALGSAFRRIHRQLKPRTPLPTITTEFYPSVGVNHSATLEKGVLNVRVSDLFLDAPADVFETLAAILLCKLYKKKIDPRHNRTYRRYTMSEDMLERRRLARTERGRRIRTTGPVGRFHDLAPLFESINTEYFRDALPKPELSWSPVRTRRVLGRYDFDRNVIFLSKSLDTPSVPEYVVQYVLFHEMLHVKHGTRIRNLRKIVHTPEFRREERRYEFYDAANAWLKDN